MESKLSRRDLLDYSTVLLLMVPVAGLAACSSSPSGDGSASCNGVFETSTVTNNHTHTLCVPTTDLTTPPSAGVTYTTSLAASHTHTVTLTQAQLQTIEGGGSVTVTTSAPLAHDFTISKSS